MRVKKVQCQNCKAVLEIDPHTGDATCKYCGTKVYVKDVVTNNITNNYITENIVKKTKPKKEKRQSNVSVGEILFSIAALILSLFQVRAIYSPDIYEEWFSVHPPIGFLLPYVIMCVFYGVLIFSDSSLCSSCMVVLTEVTFWGIMNYWIDVSGYVMAIIIGAITGIALSCLVCWISDEEGPTGGATFICAAVLWIEVFVEFGSEVPIALQWKVLPILVIAVISFCLQEFGDGF